MTASEPGGIAALLSLRDIVSQRGAAAPGLAGVDLDLKEREILAVVGPAGAGKTALLAILAGSRPFESGSVVFRGYPIRLRGPRDGVRIGIARSRGPCELVPDLSVYENVVLPSLGRPARLELQSQRQQVAALLAALSPDEIPLDSPVGRLSRSHALVVGLAQALSSRAKLYLFDDPFAFLAPREADAFAMMLGRLRTSGCGIVITGCRLDEVLPVADRVMALVDGRTVLSGDARNGEDRPRLQHVVGPPQGRAATRPAPSTQSPTAVVAGLSSLPELRHASFEVKPGEILAVYGRPGSGATALVESLAGLRLRQGSITLGGQTVPANALRKPVDWGIAFCGPSSPVAMAHRGRPRSLLGLLSGRPGDPSDKWRQLGLTDRDLQASSPGLSAGLAQRIMVAASIARGPRLLVLDDPVRGLPTVDRSAIYAAIRAAAGRGCAVVMACSDPGEALSMADRILVMRDGQAIGDLPRAMLDEESLALLSLPATAMTRHATALADLAEENHGAAFWATLGSDHVVCLDLTAADERANPGLSPACALALAQTRIPEALRRRSPGEFVGEADGLRSTMLAPVRSRLGRPLGWIGLTIGPDQPLPPPAAVTFRIEALGAAL